MTTRKIYTFRLNDITPDDHIGRLGEITYRNGYLYYHDGATAGGDVIGGGGGGGPTSWTSVAGKPTFAAVATSGSYDDLTDKPTIPTAYTLPTATTSVLGGVKVDGTTVTITDGVISSVGGGGGSSDRLVNGEHEVVLGSTGTVTLPAGGTITEGVVTSNPTIQLTPAGPAAGPDVASQKLVIKGGASVDYHLHLTTGDLTETSIFLGTDDHNVRTTVNGGIEITTPSEINKVWQFGTDGKLYLPSIGDGGGAILGSPLNESIGISAYNDTGEGTTYTLSVATTGPINIPTASTGLGRLQNQDGIEILTNSGGAAKLWAFDDDGSLTLPNGAVVRDTAALAVAFGSSAGTTTQGSAAVAIGVNAGNDTQGNYAVAIGAGAGQTNQAANSIVINATDSALQNTTANSLVVAPIRSDNTPANVLYYNTTTKEITYGAGAGFSGDYDDLTNKPTIRIAVASGGGPGGNDQADSLALAGLNPTENIPSTWGGDLILQGGVGGSNGDLYGEVRIKSGTIGANYEWHFTTDKKIKLPAGGDIVDSVGTSVLGSGVSYTPAAASSWASPAPTTIAQALDRLAAKIAYLSGSGV